MGTVNINAMSMVRQKQNTPWGNSTHLRFHMETNASGVVLNSDLATALQAADVIRLGEIPAGFLIEDALVNLSNAFSASSTFHLGFLYTDGVDDASVPQDAQYICASLAADATSVSRKTGIKAPVQLPKPAWLVLTNNVAAQAVIGIIDVSVQGVDLGLSGGAPGYPSSAYPGTT